MASIKRPGVEVTQENVTAQVTVASPQLTTVIVGPCKQIVEAFDDSGDAQSEALAGSYQDGKGTIAYALPSLKTGAVVDSSSIRVFRVDGAGSSVELRDSDNEETILSGTSGVYTYSTGNFTDGSTDFSTSGVVKGDFVRVTYRGEVLDLEITAAVSSGLNITVDTGSIAHDVTFASYSIVRNPAQFVFKSSAEQADAEIGDVTSPESNYLHVAIKSTAASTLTGAAGDGFKLQLKETDPYYSIAYAATGNGFYTGTGVGDDFVGLNSSGAGPAAVTTLAANAVLLVSEDGASPIGQTTFASANARADLLAGSGGDDAAALVTAVSLGSSPQGVVAKIVAIDNADEVNKYDSGILQLDSHGLTASDVSDQKAYVYLSDGTNAQLYKVTDVPTTDSVELDSGARPGTSITFTGGTGRAYSVLTNDGPANAIALTVGALTSVYDYSATSTVETVLTTGPLGKSIVFGSDAMATAAYQPIDSVSGRVVTLSAVLSSPAAGTAVSGGASGKQAQAVDTTATTDFVEPSGTGVTYQIVLPRTAGESTVGLAALASDLGGDSTFSANFEATDNGTGTFTYAEATTVNFDGGVDADNLLLDADLIGSTTATHSIYVSYKALRVDLSDQASSPALTSISSTTDVTTYLGTISSDNPLALAAYMAALQSPSTTFKVLGVSETSTAEPDGTTAAYTSALEFLESEDVYAMSVLTSDPALQALLKTHVEAMSLPANKSERIGFVSQDMPTHSKAVLISSGTSGNTGASFDTDNTFTTNVDFALNSTFNSVLSDSADDMILVVTALSSSTAAPTAANGVIPVKYGIRVDKTSTAAVSDSTTLVLNNSDVEDSTVGTDWNSLVDVNWALYQMGTALSTAAAKATAVAGLGAQFESKRMFLVWPDTASASVSGSAVSMGGEYLAAAWAAKVGYERAETPFTNRTLTGFSSVTNSNGLFSRSQLDEIAGGGTYITVQDSPSAALSCRHQLSTKVDTIQNRELSITKTVDYVAKQLRQVLEPKIGSFLITQSYLDSLGTITEGVIRNFSETGVINSGQVNFIEVDEDASDTINIQIIISVPFPANYIALTLQF